MPAKVTHLWIVALRGFGWGEETIAPGTLKKLPATFADQMRYSGKARMASPEEVTEGIRKEAEAAAAVRTVSDLQALVLDQQAMIESLTAKVAELEAQLAPVDEGDEAAPKKKGR